MNSMRQRVQDEGGEEKDEISIIYFFLRSSNQKVPLATDPLHYKWKETSWCRLVVFFFYNTQRFGKGSGIFCTPKLRTQVIHHTFLENICCPTQSGQQSAQRIRELFQRVEGNRKQYQYTAMMMKATSNINSQGFGIARGESYSALKNWRGQFRECWASSKLFLQL